MKRVIAVAALVVGLVLGPVAAPPPAAASSGEYCGHYSHVFWSGYHMHWWMTSHDSKLVYGGYYYNKLDGRHYHRYALYQYHNNQWVYDHNIDRKC